MKAQLEAAESHRSSHEFTFIDRAARSRRERRSEERYEGEESDEATKGRNE